jgi:hypothetical protein
MKYIEVETPYGLQKYPAYGIGGFVKNIFKGLKDVAKKVAPILPLALSFAPGFQALSPLTRGIVSGLSSAAASKLAGADTDDAIRSGFLVGGTSMLPALIGGQKLTEGAKLTDVLSKDRGYLKGLFSGYQAPSVPVPEPKMVFDSASNKMIDVSQMGPTFDDATISAYSKNFNIPESRVPDFIKEYNIAKSTPGLETVSMEKYADTFKRNLPLTERAKDFLGTTTGKIAATAVASPLIAAALDPQEEAKSSMSRETGEDFIERDPLKYIVQNLQNVKYTPEGRIDFSGSRTAAQGGIMSEAPKKYAMGSNPMNQFVPRNGLIPSMGEEGENGVSDNVKALLSPDEFVFTKQAVQAAGGGDVMAGAKRLMAQMKQLEARGAQMGIGKA